MTGFFAGVGDHYAAASAPALGLAWYVLLGVFFTRSSPS
jgi:hypothetical protein